MARDYQKDLEVCEKATPGPWEWTEDRYWCGYSGIVGKDNAEVLYPSHSNDGDDGAAWFDDLPSETDCEFMVMSREALPYYIKKCMELEAQVGQMRELLKSKGVDVK